MRAISAWFDSLPDSSNSFHSIAFFRSFLADGVKLARNPMFLLSFLAFFIMFSYMKTSSIMVLSDTNPGSQMETCPFCVHHSELIFRKMLLRTDC